MPEISLLPASIYSTLLDFRLNLPSSTAFPAFRLSSGKTSSTSSAALSAMRLAPQLGQNPRRLQLNATRCS